MRIRKGDPTLQIILPNKLKKNQATPNKETICEIRNARRYPAGKSNFKSFL